MTSCAVLCVVPHLPATSSPSAGRQAHAGYQEHRLRRWRPLRGGLRVDVTRVRGGHAWRFVVRLRRRPFGLFLRFGRALVVAGRRVAPRYAVRRCGSRRGCGGLSWRLWVWFPTVSTPGGIDACSVSGGCIGVADGGSRVGPACDVPAQPGPRTSAPAAVTVCCGTGPDPTIPMAFPCCGVPPISVGPLATLPCAGLHPCTMGGEAGEPGGCRAAQRAAAPDRRHDQPDGSPESWEGGGPGGGGPASAPSIPESIFAAPQHDSPKPFARSTTIRCRLPA